MGDRNYISETVGALAGVAFCVLLFLATASFDPLTEATDAELAAWWADSGNLRDNVISMYLMIASIPFFLLFLVTLWRRLTAADDQGKAASTFVLASGVCFAAAVLITAVSRGMIAQSVRFGDEPLPGPDTLRTVTVFASTMYGVAVMPAAAVTLAGASWLIVRSGAMAAWLGWSGLAVAGVILVAMVFLVAAWVLPLLFLWVTATSVELWRTQGRRPSVARDAPRVATTSDAGVH